MLVRIVKRTFSGAEYCPEQKVLKLGGEGSTGVETLEFELPEEWAGMAVTVHVQQLDGTLPQPVLLAGSASSSPKLYEEIGGLGGSMVTMGDVYVCPHRVQRYVAFSPSSAITI